MGGQKTFDRKPHLLINAETGSNYYRVRVPAFCQTTNREMLMSLELQLRHWSQLLSWRERANLVVRTERFFRMLRTSSLNACANQCTFAIRLSRDSTWLSKQLKNGSSLPRASEATDRGKHAYRDGELQIAENQLKGGASLRSQ